MKMRTCWLFTALLVCACLTLSRLPECRAKEVTADKLTKLAQDFLKDLGANKTDALAAASGTPWYNGGELVKKDEDLRVILQAMAKWYAENEGAARYHDLAAGTYKKLKTEESSDLGPNDIKKIDTFLSANDWLVVVGKVGKEKKPTMYLLVKERNGKLTIVGAHK